MNTTDQPTHEPGWRMLDKNDNSERLQKDDEVSTDGEVSWGPIRDDAIGWKLTPYWDYTDVSFRRRLPSQPETPSGPPDALPPKDEAQETPTDKPVAELVIDTLHERISDLERQLFDMNERRKKEVAGAMHSSECWELMHAKRHEELEQAQRALTAAEGERATMMKQRDATIAALTHAEKALESAYSYLQTCQCDCSIADQDGGIEVCGRCVMASEIDSELSRIDTLNAALSKLQALKAVPLPVPQTPQEHIEAVMKVGFDRGCG